MTLYKLLFEDKNTHTRLGDRAWVDLTVISPPHPYRAAALLLGDISGQDAVAEHSVIQI